MNVARTDPQSLKSYLSSAGIWSKKQLGQHFLINSGVLDDILAAAEVTKDDVVVEIGPGPGVLTERLLAAEARVVAFEIDTDFIPLLRRDLPEAEIIEGDVLQTAPSIVAELGNYKVVANIPYQITTPLIKLFLEGGVTNSPTSLTLLVQKEVGERLAAKAKQANRGYLSVLVQYFAEISLVSVVPRAYFWPIPNVDSAVIHLHVRHTRLFAESQERDFLKYVKRMFTQPRKQLKNVLAGIRGCTTAEVAILFASLGFPENVRAQELTVEQWRELYLTEKGEK